VYVCVWYNGKTHLDKKKLSIIHGSFQNKTLTSNQPPPSTHTLTHSPPDPKPLHTIYIYIYIHIYLNLAHSDTFVNTLSHTHAQTHKDRAQTHMGWLRLVGSLKLQIYFAKKPYKRDDILQKKPVILRSLLIVATPSSLRTNTQQTRAHTVCGGFG